MKTFEQLYKGPAFWNIDPNRAVIKPFPGRWPTRWRLSLFDADAKVKWMYIGKPNPLLIDRVFRRAKAEHGTVLLHEFDQLGVFREVMQNTPRADLRLSNYNGIACYAYYPWHTAIAEFFMPYPMYHYRVHRGPQVWCVYSPYPEMKAENHIQMWREYRGWLRKANPYKMST